MRSERQKSLKPLLTIGQPVYSAYWDPITDPQRLSSPQWYPGIVTSFKVSKLADDIKYGYVRYYNINFDDGDVMKDVRDAFVMDANEYELSVLKESDDDEGDSDHDDDEKSKGGGGETREWKGVRNICDRASNDAWAKHVGWYVATLSDSSEGGGNNKVVEHTFSLLSDALRSYDSHIVRTKGMLAVKEEDLNLPHDWEQLFKDQKKALAKISKKEEDALSDEKKKNMEEDEVAATKEQIKEQIKQGIAKAQKRHKAELDRVKHHLRKKHEETTAVAVCDAIDSEQRKCRDEKMQFKKEMKLVHDTKIASLREEFDDEKEQLEEKLTKEAERREKLSLKPFLEVGEEVYAAWWPDRNFKDTASWYPGRVKSYIEVEPKTKNGAMDVEGEESYYGPVRIYTIRYDEDGSELDGIPEEFVFPKKDYLLSTMHSPKSKKKSLAKEEVEEGPAVEFPDGWNMKKIPRKNKSKKQYDTFYFSPVQNYKFKSRPEVTRYLQCLNEVNGDETAALGLFRGNTKISFSSSAMTTSQKSEYSTSTESTIWKGVKNVVDESSNDEWAKFVGWYVFDNVDTGERHSFSRLSDALYAHDASVVRAKGDKTKRSDLNLPDEWEWLFSKSGVVEPVLYTEEEMENEKEQLKKKLGKKHEQEKALAVKEALDAERRKHKSSWAQLRKEWLNKSEEEKAEAVEAATLSGKARLNAAMKEAKKAMRETRERDELATKEATVLHNLQMDKLRKELHQQYEHEKEKALYWLRVEMEQVQRQQQEQLELAQQTVTEAEVNAALQKYKSEESPVVKKKFLRRGSVGSLGDLSAPPAKRTKLTTSACDDSAPEVTLPPPELKSSVSDGSTPGVAIAATLAKQMISTVSAPGVAARRGSVTPVPGDPFKENFPQVGTKPSPNSTLTKQRKTKSMVDQTAGENTTEVRPNGGHQAAVEALLNYAEKMDSEEEENSIHSKSSIDEKGNQDDGGVEKLEVRIIL